MQVDGPQMIRNIALAGHGDTGKTTLASAFLFTSGVSSRLNRVEDGNAVTDFDPEEVERSMSISLGVCHAPWDKTKINIIDTPGAGIFGPESRGGVRAADSTVMVINAGAGVQVTTETLWAFSKKIEQPCLLHINKLDRENTDFDSVVAGLQENFGRKVTPIQLPIGKEADFHGVIDLVSQKAYTFEKDGDGKGTEVDVPAEMADAVESARTALVEAVAESNEELLELFFAEGDLTAAQLTEGLKTAVRAREIYPVTVGCALHGIGTSSFLDVVVDYLPDPTDRLPYPATTIGGDDAEIKAKPTEPASALVFKTLNDPFAGRINFLRVLSGEIASDTSVWNVRVEDTEKIGTLQAMQGKQGTAIQKLVTGDIAGVAKLKHTSTGDTLCVKEKPIKLGWIDLRPPAMSYAIEPKSKGDEEKISDALHRLMDEDLGLSSGRDPQTGEVLLSGSGQLHVEIAVAKLKNRYKVEVILHQPKVPYRETIRKAADGHGRHKKQTGGRGQFGDCKIKVEPTNDGTEFEFIDEIFGGSIPQGFRPAVEKGIQETRQRGFLAGYPVVNFRVRLLDGQYHDVDSSEMAFKVAGSLAFKDAMNRAGATLLEPIMQVEINTTEEFMGDIMGDLSQRRGRPQGMDTNGAKQIIKATVPMAEMLDYAASLRSITQGRSRFTMEFSHYDEVPKQIQEKIITEAKTEDEA